MRSASPEDNFQITKGFKSYVSKPEITDLGPNFLVKGSKNVLIDYAQRIVSRFGFTLYRQAATGGGGIKSSYEWATSTAKEFSLRVYDAQIEFDWNGVYNVLKTGLATPYLEFAKVWDNTEKIDVLLWVMGDTNMYKWSGGVAKVRASTGTTLTKQGVLTGTTFAFVAGVAGVTAATITDSALNFLNAGFAAGDTLYVSGSASNNRNFTIGSVTADTLTLIITDTLTNEAAGAAVTVHNGEPTWASSRFLTTGTRSLRYNGVDYAYTGGEATDTLTGLVAFPAVTVGDPVWQNVQTLANPSPLATFKADLIGVQLNQVILASTKSQDIYGSSTLDYTNFTPGAPRAPADAFHVTMDNYATCIVPIDNPNQTSTSLMFGGGHSEFFQLSFQMSQDLSSELVRMIKLKTATSSGLISKSAIANIKEAVVYISREPGLEILSNVQAADKNDVPLSDPIKDDFDAYDFTGAHVKYAKRSIYIALPAEGLVLIYDLMRSLWQPPQTIPVSRLAIIGDELYGHSAVSNETYKLFDGTNDNGNFISQVARFAYNNGGRRDRLKNMSEYWTDGYITANGLLQMNQRFGFNGMLGLKQMYIDGSDTAVVSPVDSDPLGSDPLGSNPLGGAVSDAQSLPIGLRFWQIDTMGLLDYTEQFTEYTMDSLDGRFAVVAHGSNQIDAGTVPISHKK